MAFFEFTQNNSGGTYSFSDNAYSRFVVIEAPSATTANALALGLGLYWDGVDKGYDCACCGSRWSQAWSDDGDEKPSHYGDPIHEMEAYSWRGRDDDKPEGFVHYLNGKIEAVYFDTDGSVRVVPTKVVENKAGMGVAA